MVHTLDNATIMKMTELYKKYGSISKVARALNLSKGVVHKYMTLWKAGKLNLPPLPSPQKVEPATEIEAKPVHVNIHEFISEQTLKTLHVLAIKEDFAGIDDCVKGLIDFYITTKVAVGRAMGQKFYLKQDKEHYLPLSFADFMFGYQYISLRTAAVYGVASSLDSTVQAALGVAGLFVDQIVKSPEFTEAYMRNFREWYDENRSTLLTAKLDTPKQILSVSPVSHMEKLSRWLSEKAYPKAKELWDSEPEK